MEYLKTAGVSLFSLATLFLLTKLIGKKQVSELTMFDYVISISIGSIAAEMATELENPIKPLLAMVIYAVVSIIVSIATSKSLKARRLLFGRTTLLMSGGRLYRKNFKKSHLDLSEFLMQCRSAGYFDLSAIDTAVLEPSGRLSILPFSNKRPITAEDLKTVPATDNICFNVIMDGAILENELKSTGFNEVWLRSELKANGVKSEKDVFLATLDRSGTLNIYKNYDNKVKNDYFA